MPDAETASILMINGVEAPTPADFLPTYSDQDSENSKRSETAVLTREIVRTNLRSHSFRWKLQTPDMRKLLNMVLPARLTVRFFDLYAPADSPYTEFIGYASPTRTVKLLKWEPNAPEQSWWEIQLDFIEY